MTRAARIYCTVLRLFPRGYRDRYVTEALADFEALYLERRAERGPIAAARFAGWCVLRAVGGAVAEWGADVTGALTRTTHGARVADAGPTGTGSGTPQPSLRRSVLGMRHDLKYAYRALAVRPGFAATVILLLATGIGAATAVFSVVDAVLLRQLPYPDPDRLVTLQQGAHAPADFADWEREIESIETWGGVFSDETDITGTERPDRIGVGRVTPNLFSVLGARATLGRLFTPDEHAGDPDVAVVSHRFCQDRWGSDPELLGRQIRVGDRPLTVVGIMASDFIMLGGLERRQTSVWTPLDVHDPAIQSRGLHIIEVVARLAPGVTFEAARAEMELTNERFADRYPDSHRRRDGSAVTTPMVTLQEAVVGEVQGTLLMLMGAVGLLLLLACVNVANLLLARGADRTRELALRGALGATRANVLAQLTTEALLLSLAGGAVGVGLAFLGVRLFEILEPGVLPRTEAVGVDLRVLGFALAASVVTGLVFGLVPALQATRVDVNAALKDGASGSTVGRGRARVQGSLVVSEVALSLILLTGAGLLFHSFIRLTRVDTGFDPARLVTIDLQLGDPYDVDSRILFVDELTRRLRAVPGTRAVVAGATLPFQYASGGTCCFQSSVTTPGAADGEDMRTVLHPVTPGFLSALEVPILSGRDIQPGDQHVEPIPVVLGENAAKTLFGEANPLGKTISFVGREARVVGVAGNVQHASYGRAARPELYMPWEVRGPDIPFLNIAMRTDLDVGAVAPAIRAAIWDLDPNLPIPDIVSMEGRMARSVADERFYSVILATFALVALLLAAGGVYATFLYSVRQRVREMGIRLALGARRADVVRLVLRRGLVLTAIGVVVGLGAAALGARFLASMVFGITPHDPLTYTIVSALMAIVALGACLVPAVRAGRTDPLETLRAE